MLNKGLADKSRSGIMTIHGVADEVEDLLSKRVSQMQPYFDKQPGVLPMPPAIKNPGEFVFVNPAMGQVTWDQSERRCNLPRRR